MGSSRYIEIQLENEAKKTTRKFNGPVNLIIKARLRAKFLL